MANESQAISNVKPVAERLCSMLGWPVAVAPVLGAQFILEKGWAYWGNYPVDANATDYNFGNAGNPFDHALPHVSSEEAGCLLYATVLVFGNPSAYAEYYHAMESGDAEAGLHALAVSPWCAPPYGQTLVDVYNQVLPLWQVASAHSGSTPKNIYTVQAGDTLWGIVEKTGVPYRVLLSKNPQLSNPNLIVPGEVLNI